MCAGYLEIERTVISNIETDIKQWMYAEKLEMKLKGVEPDKKFIQLRRMVTRVFKWYNAGKIHLSEDELRTIVDTYLEKENTKNEYIREVMNGFSYLDTDESKKAVKNAAKLKKVLDKVVDNYIKIIVDILENNYYRQQGLELL
jgi:hypothetical protein